MKNGKPALRIDPPTPSPQPNLDLTRLIPALERLAEALLLSRVRREDPWERALCLSELAPLGLTPDDCRALVASGYLETPHEPSPSGRKVAGSLREPSGRKRTSSARRRTEAPSTPRPPHIGPKTLLLLTDLGLAKLTATLQKSAAAPPSISPSPTGRGQGEGLSVSPSVPPSSILPHYDIDLRELSVAGDVILRLSLQARNLHAVLNSIQLAGWKQQVSKPLNGRPDGSDPQHLADAVYGLNHHQSLIEFRTDGAAIRWKWRQSAERRVRLFDQPHASAYLPLA